MPMRSLTLFLAFCAFATSVFGQAVRWEPATGRLSYNQVNELELIFEDCEPSGDPALPHVTGLDMQVNGSSSNMTVINGHISQTVAITVNVRATQKKPITIPAFSVATSKGTLQVAAANYQVGDATVGSTNLALNDVASGTIDVPKEVWAGEVFRLEYDLSIIRRYLYSPNGTAPEWDSAPLTVEDWSRPEVFQSNAGGDQRVVFSYKTRAMTRKPGTISLNSVSQTVNLVTGTSGNNFFFSQPSLQPFTIASSRPSIVVKPLPQNAPESFKGAVGHFTLDSKVVPNTGMVGEPITWTLTLVGNGNWPDIKGLPPREVSRDFRVVQPQAHRTMKDNGLFDGSISEDVVLIPTQPGTYTLGPLSWSYFDPSKGDYQTITTPKVVVTVAAAPTQPTPPPSATGTSPTISGTNPSSSPETVVAPVAPSPIPRDPLPENALASLPWNARVFTLALLAPLPCLLIVWLLLALRRAQATDPNRRLRSAAAKLRTILDDVANARDSAAVHRGLQAWQRESAILWRFAPVVPRPQDFIAAAPQDDANAKAWAQLWNETERVLYRSNEALPGDWVARARAALDRKPAPSFSPLQLFRLKNLLPFAAAWLIFALGAPHAKAAEASGSQSYRSGDFAAAEKSWQTALQAHGNDWSARYNLSLALEQQSRWGEASAEAIAAFVQHPNDPAVRWNLAFAIDHAGFSPDVMTGFLSESPAYSVARLLSPAGWQRAMVIASTVFAIGILLILLRFYAPLGRWSSITGLAIAILSIGAFGFGAISLNRYQETGDTRSVIIWKPSLLRSIPTEVDAQQKTTPLAPGTIAIVDKNFLTWQRLSFPNGQTGWVRQEDVVRLWE